MFSSYLLQLHYNCKQQQRIRLQINAVTTLAVIKMWWFVWTVLAGVGLAQLPLLVDCLRAFFPNWRISRFAGRVSSILLVAFLCGIAVVALSYFFLVFLPLHTKDSFNSFEGWFHISFAVWVWLNMAFHYAMAVFASPGIVPAVPAAKADKSPRAGDTGSASTANALPEPPCPQHSCKRCNAVILYMDHHCPFTANCVGLENYKNFILMLSYGWVGLVYALRMTLPYFYKCHFVKFLWVFNLTSGPLKMTKAALQMCWELGPHTLITVPLVMGVTAVSTLLAWQAVMLLADVSTVHILSSKGLALRDVFQRVRQRKFAAKDSRLQVMLIDRTSTYDLVSVVIIVSFFIFS